MTSWVAVFLGFVLLRAVLIARRSPFAGFGLGTLFRRGAPRSSRGGM